MKPSQGSVLSVLQLPVGGRGHNCCLFASTAMLSCELLLLYCARLFIILCYDFLLASDVVFFLLNYAAMISASDAMLGCWLRLLCNAMLLASDAMLCYLLSLV